jgi:hypothetical protein
MVCQFNILLDEGRPGNAVRVQKDQRVEPSLFDADVSCSARLKVETTQADSAQDPKVSTIAVRR